MRSSRKSPNLDLSTPWRTYLIHPGRITYIQIYLFIIIWYDRYWYDMTCYDIDMTWHDMTWYNNILYSIIAVFFSLNWMVFNWMGWKHNVDAVMRPELAGSRGRFGTLPWAGELKWYTGESGTCNMWGLSENGVKLMRLLMFNYGIEIIKWEYPSMIEILMGYTMIFDTWDMSDMQSNHIKTMLYCGAL